MINKLKLVFAKGTDPVRNLAVESVLLDGCEKEEMILYLWQNANTVVIGRNQNVYQECAMTEIEKDQVTIVRRPSGGGAVYHDLGNLNYTFITDDSNASVKRQTNVILQALSALGLPVEISGRNDLLCKGRKFSGNAYYHHYGYSYQHGTLLISTDLEKLSRYLKPDPEKLKMKGVESYRSRVMNLSEERSDLTVSKVQSALISAFEAEYACTAEELSKLQEDRIQSYETKYGSAEWIYGKNPLFEIVYQKRFSWGGVKIGLTVKKGIIEEVKLWSDAMDPDISTVTEKMLKGCPFNCAAVKERFDPISREKEIGFWLQEEICRTSGKGQERENEI